jgi:hypothetical protein
MACFVSEVTFRPNIRLKITSNYDSMLLGNQSCRATANLQSQAISVRAYFR